MNFAPAAQFYPIICPNDLTELRQPVTVVPSAFPQLRQPVMPNCS